MLSERERQINELAPVLGKAVKEAIDITLKTCLNCYYFTEQTEQCNKYNMRPPARIIAFSCPDYLSSQEIPY